jgi:hypothetical protein
MNARESDPNGCRRSTKYGTSSRGCRLARPTTDTALCRDQRWTLWRLRTDIRARGGLCSPIAATRHSGPTLGGGASAQGWQQMGNTPTGTSRKRPGSETPEIGLFSAVNVTDRNQPQTPRLPRNEGVCGSNPLVAPCLVAALTRTFMVSLRSGVAHEGGGGHSTQQGDGRTLSAVVRREQRARQVLRARHAAV